MSKLNLSNIKKTIYYLKRNGIGDTITAVRERMSKKSFVPYTYTEPTDEELLWQQNETKTNTLYDFTISVVVPAYKTNKEYLLDLINSLLDQSYCRWELVIADASDDNSVKNIVEQFEDERILYRKLSANRGISANTNEALKYATGSYIGLLDHDDVLTKDALFNVARVIVENKSEGIISELIYSDEDKCDSQKEQFFEVHNKEDFNLDLILSNNYICHFLVMKSELINDLGFREEYDGAQDYDLVLRAVSRLKNTPWKISHIEKVLYHWRCHSASTAENPASKQYAYEAGMRALQDYAHRENYNATAKSLKHLGFYQLVYNGNIFLTRTDIAAVGGPIYKRNALVGGRISHEGYCYYEGSPAGFSGYMHRISLTQDAYALDIRNIIVADEYIKLFEEITGVTYKVNENNGTFDYRVLKADTDYMALSVLFAKRVHEATDSTRKLFLYMPDMCIKM